MDAKNFKRTQKILLILVFVFTNATFTFSQKNLLARKISINIARVELKDALIRIGENGNFNFSYNSEIIEGSKIVSLFYEREKTEKILNTLFKGKIQYKIAGNYIILLGKEQEKTKRQIKEIQKYTVTGYIIDSRTGIKLKSATIYDLDGMNSAITSAEGFYTINLMGNKEFWGLNYCKNGYLDTVIIVKAQNNTKIDIKLEPLLVDIDKLQPQTAHLETGQVNNSQIVNWFVSEEAQITATNLNIYEKRIGQISFIPFIGSYSMVSGAMVYNSSLNILAGYSGGIEGVELGGLFNLDKNYMHGVQIGGIGNIVGKETVGLQIAGMFNINAGSVDGCQIAGFNNVVVDDVTGVQVSGFNNIIRGQMTGLQMTGFCNILHGEMDGAQISGFTNITTKNVDGLQLTGFANIARNDVDIAQIAGFFNYCGNVEGLQLAGFINVAKDENSGAQISGFANYAKEINGVQVAGFINYANELNGVQVSFINICEFAESGVPIGFFSFVRNGYHVLEITADEIFYSNLSFKTGTNHLYNIFKAAVGKSGRSSYGYGLGSKFDLNQMLSLSLDLTSNTVFENGAWDFDLNLLNKLSLAIDIKLAEHLTITAGPSFNVHVSQLKNEDTGEFTSDIAFNPFSEYISRNTRTQMWVGGMFGIRF